MRNQQSAHDRVEEAKRILLDERSKVLDHLRAVAPVPFELWMDARMESINMRNLVSELEEMQDAATEETSSMWEEAVATCKKLHEDAVSKEKEAGQELADKHPAAWEKLCDLENAYRQLHRATNSKGKASNS